MNKRFAAIANFFFGSSMLVFGIVVGLVMVPLYLRKFDTATYGAWLASGNVIGMLGILESGLSTVLTQKLAVAYAEDDRRRFAALTGSGVLVALIIGIVVALSGSALAGFIPAWVHAPAEQRHAISLAVHIASIAAGMSIVFYTLGAVPQAWQRTVVPGIIGVVAVVANISAILLGLHFGYGVVALALGPLALSGAYNLGYLLYLWSTWGELQLPRPAVSRTLVWDIINDSKMLLLARMSSALGSNLEITAAAVLVSPNASAVLSITGKVILVIQGFMERIGTAVFAGVAHLTGGSKSSNESQALREIVLLGTIFSGFGLGLAIAFTGPVVTLWVGRSLYGGRPLLLIIALAAFFAFKKSLISNLTIASGQVRSSSWLLMLDAFLRVALIALLGWLLKLAGIPLGGAVASAVVALLLSRLYRTALHKTSGELWLPGMRGMTSSLLIGILWLLLAPGAANLRSLAVQGMICSGVMLVTSALVEREWLVSLRRNGAGVRKAIAARGSS